MRLLLVVGLLVGAIGLSCSGTDSEQQTLCEPGENILCKCRGGKTGTHTCKPDGNSFESECITDSGACQEIIPDTTSGGMTTGDPGTGGNPTMSSTGGAGGTGGGGDGGSPPVGDKGLFEPCSSDGDCASGQCPMGYCTIACEDYNDCVGEQVLGECQLATYLCAPLCTAGQSDCVQFGDESLCSIETSEDNYEAPVCGNWETVYLPGDDVVCSDDIECNLGHPGAARICAFERCVDGCRDAFDCPEGTDCQPGGGDDSFGICE